MTDFEAQSGHKKGQLRLSAAGAVAELQLLSSIRSILMAETGWSADYPLIVDDRSTAEIGRYGVGGDLGSGVRGLIASTGLIPNPENSGDGIGLASFLASI